MTATATKPAKKVDPKQHTRLRERATMQMAALNVDETAGVIKDVLVLGNNSRGMGVYPPEVQQAALTEYDGKPTFVNHTRDGSNPNYESKLGVHRNPRMSPEGIRTDFHFNPQHECASQLIWDAKNDPKNVGFSHDADCSYEIVGGRRVVHSIDKVYSIDLVTKPGTTGGLFEEENAFSGDEKLSALAVDVLSGIDNVRSILFTRDEQCEPKRARLLESIDELRGTLSGETTPKAAGESGSGKLQEESAMAADLKDLTVDQLTKDRPDLVALLQGKDDKSRLTEETNTLKQQLAAKETELAELRAKEQSRLVEDAIARELAAAKFPTNDPKAYSAKFKEELRKCPDAAARKLAIDDRMNLLSGHVQEAALPAPLTDFTPAATTTEPVNTAAEKRFFG